MSVFPHVTTIFSKRARSWWGVLVFLTAAVSVSIYCALPPRPLIVPFEPSLPFRIDFGRGSGWHGLETVSIAEDGSTVLHRQKDTGNWERATLNLAPEQLRGIGSAIVRNDLTKLGKTYRDDRIVDGTQWVLWIRQDGREKTSYFDNYMPSPIIAFAMELDELLRKAGVGKVNWEMIGQKRGHDRMLWDAIRR